MDSWPRVTIVTPSFNQAAFLERTLRSVLEQDYPNLEYIVIDGGSTDGSLEIIQRYADRLTFWSSKPDAGQADGINKGLRRATGEFAAWLNSDDTYQPGAIREAVEALKTDPELGMVYGNVESVDEHGHTIHIQRFEQYSLQDLMQFSIIGQPSVFMRRSVLERAGYLDLNYHYLLDHQLWLRMAALAPMQHVPRTWSKASYHQQAKNLAGGAKFGEEALRMVDWMRQDEFISLVLPGNEKQVLAGAYRIQGYYLSVGGEYQAALNAYRICFNLSPRQAVKDWKRVAYTCGAALGMGWLQPLYRKMTRDQYSETDKDHS